MSETSVVAEDRVTFAIKELRAGHVTGIADACRIIAEALDDLNEQSKQHKRLRELQDLTIGRLNMFWDEQMKTIKELHNAVNRANFNANNSDNRLDVLSDRISALEAEGRKP